MVSRQKGSAPGSTDSRRVAEHKLCVCVEFTTMEGIKALGCAFLAMLIGVELAMPRNATFGIEIGVFRRMQCMRLPCMPPRRRWLAAGELPLYECSSYVDKMAAF